MAVAFSVLVNGKLLFTAGNPGNTAESTRPRFYPQVAEYNPRAGQLDVIIQVSNFHHRKGGAWESILLGSKDEICQKRQNALTLNLFLFGGIAHDFNNILASIMGKISLALLDADPKDSIYDFLEKAEQASQRATGLTHQLLTFSRGGAPVKKVSPIAKVIVDCATFVLSGSKVRCDFNLPADLWPVVIEVDQISQVIQNIIINADQAMPDGGIIRIRAENITVAADNKLALTSGRFVKIAIQIIKTTDSAVLWRNPFTMQNLSETLKSVLN